MAVVSQAYAVNVLDEYVLRGNPGILKCHIPSFVADYVYVEAWIQNEKVKFTLENSRDYGSYTLRILQLDKGDKYIYMVPLAVKVCNSNDSDFLLMLQEIDVH